MSGQVASFSATFDKIALENLEHCADILSRERSEKTIDPKELAKIANDAKQLRRETEAAEIDVELKAYILEGLDDITSAIDDYDLEGIASLEHGVERAFGTILLKKEKADKAVKTVIGSRFGQLLYNLYLIVSIANGALQLPYNVRQLLLPYIHAQTEQRESTPDSTTKSV